MTFTIKRGDTSPPIKYKLIGPDDYGKDIRGYNDVQFFMRERDEYTIVVSDDVSGNVNVVDAENGIIEYDWTAGDTETSGTYDAEWQVEFNDGSVETYPNDRFITVKIVDDIE